MTVRTLPIALATTTLLAAACGAPVDSSSEDVTETTSADVCGDQKVLVVMSSSGTLTVRGDDGALYDYPTGVFLREWTDPVLELESAGCDVEYATPRGEMVTVDSNSLEMLWQYYPYIEEKPNAAARRQAGVDLAIAHLGEVKFSREVDRWTRLTPEVQDYVARMREQSAGRRGSHEVISLEEARSRMDEYTAVLVPGGHVPMEDLVVDDELGAILREAHARRMPTSLVCHAPVSILSSAQNADGFVYAGYEVTAANRIAEQMLENVGPLQGYSVLSYVDDDLEDAGVVLRQNPWPAYPQVVVDRELITGQNPASAPFVGVTLVEAIDAYRDDPTGAWWEDVRAYRLPEDVIERHTRATRRFKKAANGLLEGWGPLPSAIDKVQAFADLFGREVDEPVNIFTSREYLALYDAALSLESSITKEGPEIVGKGGERITLDRFGVWPLRYYVYEPYFHPDSLAEPR